MKNGQGHWKRDENENTNQYQGKYKNDKKHGFGEFIWATGSIFKGNFVDDKKRGYGEMMWADGHCFRGFWKEGSQNGLGIMVFKDFKKAGFFMANVFKKPLFVYEEVEEFERQEGPLPESFKKELLDYLNRP